MATKKRVGEFDEVEYTRQIYCLGKYYNEALVGLEANFSTYPIKELERLGYRNQFVREKEDEYTNKLEKRLGFKTTSITRPLILGQLQKIVLEEVDKINDRDVYMKGIDNSYHYEGYTAFKAEEL